MTPLNARTQIHNHPCPVLIAPPWGTTTPLGCTVPSGGTPPVETASVVKVVDAPFVGDADADDEEGEAPAVE